MRIECPNCKLAGNVEDTRVPLEGTYLDCPRCKTRFMVKHEEQPQARAVKHEAPVEARPGVAVNTCPACDYSTFSEDTFERCPKCGTIAGEWTEKMQKLKEQRAQEEERRREEKRVLDKYGEADPEEDVQAVPAEEIPIQVMVLGWIAVGVAAVFLIIGLKGFFTYSAMTPPPPDPYAIEPQITSGQLFLSSGLFPLFQLMFAIYTGVAALQFLRLRQWSRLGLEISGWLALAGVVISHIIELVMWIRQSSSFPFMVIAATFFGLVIWSIPPLAAVWFLRGEVVKKTVVG